VFLLNDNLLMINKGIGIIILFCSIFHLWFFKRVMSDYPAIFHVIIVSNPLTRLAKRVVFVYRLIV
jgi:hypothetical protein